MSERIRVTEAENLEPGERELIEINGRPIGVFNVDGEYHALLNHCLHDSGPVCEGRVKKKLVGTFEEPGERVTESFSGPESITCPWHGWEYDLESGDHVGDPDISLPTFDVVEDEGVLYVEL